MRENIDKITKFTQAVTDYATAQSRKVHAEVEYHKRERLAQAEAQALAESTALMKKERVSLKKEIRLEMSKRELAARQKVLEKRREMMDTLFEEVREKLIAFTDTEAYAPFLSASVAAFQKQMPLQEATVYMAEKDEKDASMLRKMLPAGTALCFVKDITIGGMRAYHEPSGMVLDDTLDSRLEEQRDWFVSSSGLTIE